MAEGNVEIINERGMHARAASKFVHLANQFNSKITLIKDSVEVDGKSILGLLLLQASKGTTIKLVVDGSDEKEAYQKLEQMILDRFGESR
jgi:phosphocarrier protein HPr